MADKLQVANVSQFLGLRTDTPQAKCPDNFSPDCSDMIFTTGGMATRFPFRAAVTMPADIVWRKEFLAKDGSTQVIALDVNGVLYSVSPIGVATVIDAVTPGSRVSSVTAYGREYMAFFNDGGGTDAPRQWDGKNIYRVSQGGPAAAPIVQNYAIPSTDIVSLTRANNIVTAVTSSSHGLSAGFRLNISGVPVQTVGGAISEILIDNDNTPGAATITTTTAHGLHPGNVIAIMGVDDAPVGGGVLSSVAYGDIISVVTNTPHGLLPGATIVVTGLGDAPHYGDGVWTVLSITDDTTFTYEVPGANLTGTEGGAMGTIAIRFPFLDATFTVTESPTPTTFQIGISYANGDWTNGTITFPWNGTFYVGSVPSLTTLTYTQVGPDGTTGAIGKLVPNGQIAPGVHGLVCHFLTKTGFLTAASPKAVLNADGGQFAQVTIPIGPNDTVARVLSWTGANGSSYGFLPVAPRDPSDFSLIGTSTVVSDNTTTTAVLDFSDTALLSAAAARVDVPGNNLFQQTALNLARGVRWYYDRLFWIGEANTVVGFLNMAMDGGTNDGSPAPLGWNVAGGVVISQPGFMPILSGTGSVSQTAFQSLQGAPILLPNLRYSLRMWGTGTIVATISSVSTGFVSTAHFVGSYQAALFSLAMPAKIPEDMIFTLTLTGAAIRDVQMIYADNPARNPLARASYVRNPEAYDLLTGNIGPNDDSTELRALFTLGESFHFITEKSIYYAQQIGNAEPSSWNVDKISDKCGAFNAESVTTGKGWAAWGGPEGAFWYTSGSPEKTTKIIAPTWRAYANIANMYDDSDAERVYFGMVDSAGVRTMLVYDYHEVGLGGSGKWCVWNRPLRWVGSSASGTTFVFSRKFYHLDTVVGVADDDLGQIGGYYTFAPIGVSMFKKQYNYLGFRIYGAGPMTPFLYTQTLQLAPKVLNAFNIEDLLDTIAEWPSLALSGRLLYLKLGQAGVQFSLSDMSCVYQGDPNSPISGVR